MKHWLSLDYVPAVLLGATIVSFLHIILGGSNEGSKKYENEMWMMGDINCDGVVDAVDASYVLQYAAHTGIRQPNAYEEEIAKRADINGDGQTDANDAAMILEYASAVGTGDDRDIVAYFKEK